MDPARNFQHYQLLRREDGSVWELGRGTMGVTYKALDTNLHSEVALKVVSSALVDHPNARERFVREARAAAALRHRNVASVYHLGNDGEHFFYAMEFVDGETLDALVRRQGPVRVETALRIALQVARALAAAARQRLVHRDIKPANLMVAREDGDEHLLVKVIDFGLARPAAGDDGEESGAGSLTIHGFVGTPQYASPEQLEERSLDARSDIYSLGVTLWFLLTGKPPFGGSLAVVCNQHLSKPPPWGALPASVPESVRKLLAHLLEKDPAHRPQNALELRQEIERCLAALPSATAPGQAPAIAANVAAAGGHRGPMARPSAGRRHQREEPALTAPASTAGDQEIGMVLGERFALTRLAGEGGSGRVFEACDLAQDRRTVAVKVLRPGSGGDSQAEREQLREDARQVSNAPHQNLVQLLAFEPSPAAPGSSPAFVAEEWVDGFTWRDVLAARHGALPLAECLALLGQAAAAVDHANSRRLERLELGLHQIHLHFPASGTDGVEDEDRRTLLPLPVEDWPAGWLVKAEPFGLGRETVESGTWAGEVTLLPGASLPPAATYLHALARVACELLGGQPPSTADAAGRGASPRRVSLPTLNEAGNAVLDRAFADAPGFESAREFVGALADAAGFRADTPALVAPARLLSPAAEFYPSPEPESTSEPEPLPFASAAVVEDTAAASTLHGTVDLPALPEHPWRESQLARMLEEEEAGMLVNPRSSGFALAIGVIVGLVLLMAGFAAVVWEHETQPSPTVKRGVTPASTPRRPTPAPVRAAPPGTPPPLVKARSFPSPVPVQKAPPPIPEPSVAAPADTPPLVVAATTPVDQPTDQPADPTPRFNDKTVSVRLNTDPAGAEVFLQGAPLGRTPLKLNLPPGDYQFIARYRDWPEIHQDLHLTDRQTEAAADIRLMSPTQIPLGPRFSPVLENRRRRRSREGPYVGDGIPVAPAVPGAGNVPVARARPVIPGSSDEPPRYREVPPVAEPPVRRALPALEPFVREGDAAPQVDPERDR